MLVRRKVFPLGLFAAVAVFAVLAFASGGATPRAHAEGVHPSCTFVTPLPQLIQQGGGPDSVTCTFTLHGTQHTLVVNFTVTLTAIPPVRIDGCTLDSNPIHVGPCP